MKIILSEQEMVTAIREYAEKRKLMEARHPGAHVSVAFTSQRVHGEWFGKGKFATEIEYDTKEMPDDRDPR